MTLKLGVIMDPIGSITPQKDSTFAILLEAQARGWSLHYMEQRDVLVRNGQPTALMRGLQVKDQNNDWFSWQPAQLQSMTELDVILMRKDPPVDNEYLYITQILDLAQQAGVLVVNNPQSLRDFNEKIFISHFPQCCVPTLISADPQLIRAFIAEHEEVVCKPLDGMGGSSIFRLHKKDFNINVVIEVLTQQGKRHLVVQRFIPEISQGDKRILLIDGQPVPYALARMPAPGEARANLAAGGYGVGVALSERDYWICSQVGPRCRELGLLLVGLDVIGDYLTEINITSPTCIRQLDACYGLNISSQLLDVITDKLKIVNS